MSVTYPLPSARGLAAPLAAAPQLIEALPATVDLALYEGDDFYLDVTVTNPDGSAADLSTATATAQIRATAEDAAVLADFDATIVGNVIRLHLLAADSAGLPPEAVWDCQVATPDITTLVAGKLTLTQEVTRP